MTEKKKKKSRKESKQLSLPVDTSGLPPAPSESNEPVTKELGVKGPVTVDGHMHMSEQDLFHFELAQERIQSVLQQVQLNTLRAAEIKRQAEEQIRTLQSNNNQLAGIKMQREKELKDLRDAMSRAYGGLDWTKVSYDDKTGKIFVDNQPLAM